VFVHISAVERSGLNSLNEGQKISYEVQEERGKTQQSQAFQVDRLYPPFDRPSLALRLTARLALRPRP
jgi:hypothetical protein